MKTLREQLSDIEQHTYHAATDMSVHVANNYQLLIARKDKEISDLKDQLWREKSK